MIMYRVVCPQDHEFDGWFRDSASFDRQVEAGDVACPYCGAVEVTKALMAPHLARGGTLSAARGAAEDRAQAVAALLRKVREHVETNFDYVGRDFAGEARRIHYGEAEDRGIYGEATAAEVRDLHEEGIGVTPLPRPPEKAN